MLRRVTCIMSMVTRRGIRGSVFLGIITSSMSRCESMGLRIIIPEVTAERIKPAANRPRLPFK
jgi:hypothetical protein